MIQPRWIIRFLSFLVLLALLVPVAQAQILEAELKVKGLACPFCAYGLERKLKKLAGAQSVKVFINDDRALQHLWIARDPGRQRVVVVNIW